MTADQREQALAAAFERIEYAALALDHELVADIALVRAALMPPEPEHRVVSDDGWNRLNLADRRRITERLLRPVLPADLAEIQARADQAARASSMYGKTSFARAWRVRESQADVPALVAEVAASRARPTLTVEEARSLLVFIERHDPEAYRSLRPKLRAISESAS